MDIDDVVLLLKDNAIVIGVITSTVLATAALVYKIKHDRDEGNRRDKETRENIRNVLKRMHDELKDTLDAIKAEQRLRICPDHKDGRFIPFLLVQFWHNECENLIQSPEVRGTDIGINKIKDIIGAIKANNSIFDWMEHNLPPVEDPESPTHIIDYDQFPEMRENCRKMHLYQEQLRKDIPPTMQKIKEACDRLG